MRCSRCRDPGRWRAHSPDRSCERPVARPRGHWRALVPASSGVGRPGRTGIRSLRPRRAIGSRPQRQRLIRVPDWPLQVRRRPAERSSLVVRRRPAAGSAARPARRPTPASCWARSPAPGAAAHGGSGRPRAIGRDDADSSVGASGTSVPDEWLGDWTSPLEGGHLISGDGRAARIRHRLDDTAGAGRRRRRRPSPQPSTTYSSRGASLSTIGPSSPHTTMSSIRAPYSPGR